MENERDITWEPRLAILISSFARPTDLIRQVLSMGVNQTYKNIHLFVSVKGLPESVMESLVYPQLSSLLSSGVLTLRWDGNTNQTWNLLDTVKGEDIEGYDLFCKVDDDDYYHPEYLATYAEGLKLSPKGSSIYTAGNYPTIIPTSFTHRMSFLFPKGTWFAGWGDMLGMSRGVIRHLLEVMEDEKKFFSDMEKFGYGKVCDLGVREDRYYFDCMKACGPCINIHPLLMKKNITPVIVGQHTVDTSISRGLWRTRKEFFNTVRYVTEARMDKKREYVIETIEGDVFSLFNGKMTNLRTNEIERYTSFQSGVLQLPNGDVYKKNRVGRYVKIGRDS